MREIEIIELQIKSTKEWLSWSKAMECSECIREAASRLRSFQRQKRLLTQRALDGAKAPRKSKRSTGTPRK